MEGGSPRTRSVERLRKKLYEKGKQELDAGRPRKSGSMFDERRGETEPGLRLRHRRRAKAAGNIYSLDLQPPSHRAPAADSTPPLPLNKEEETNSTRELGPPPTV